MHYCNTKISSFTNVFFKFLVILIDNMELIMLKKILFLFILIIFTSTTCDAKNKSNNLYNTIVNRDKIIVGISFDSKPFGFKDSDGQVKGFEADLAREIAKRLLGSPDKIIFKNVSSQERIDLAKSGDVDMVISTITITPQRKKLIDFSNPYFVAGQAICVKKDTKIDSIYDLLNKKIIVILETTGERNIKQFLPNALIQGYISNSDAINAFINGGGDAITTDDSLLQGLVIDNSDYILLPKRLTKEPYGIAFKKSRHTTSLRNNINRIIGEINQDGTMDTIKTKWGVN